MCSFQNLYRNVLTNFTYSSPKLDMIQISFIDKLMIKLLYIHAMAYYYLAVNKNELLIHTITWINLKGIHAE